MPLKSKAAAEYVPQASLAACPSKSKYSVSAAPARLFKAGPARIAQKVGEEEKLYGSVTTMDIADQLEKQGITLERRRIILDKPIKSLGEFPVAVKLHPEVTVPVKVIVVPEP